MSANDACFFTIISRNMLFCHFCPEIEANNHQQVMSTYIKRFF